MGASQSKTAEPIIFYNQSPPLQPFSPLETQQEAPKKHVSAESKEKIEALVQKRVAEELNRLRQQQEQNNQQTYSELAKKNIENDYNSIAMKEDIEDMIAKMKRTPPADIPKDIAERQEALIVCYR
ncbi:hypothetical protein BCV71DRAFT_174353 [Rhizopus microsporus]|uniref:Uncharacterized protein n=1 Tax=Rhizopus microsporus TaxID=58291 RepID=A0A1X0SAD2_RHIZD|nr:hypothetical protein BCV71DRAFT_174353 [Rhizopus microsporus]